ncbi:hypothetical protein SH1V18_07020 [Vallitalea longa]|uniref:Uroporphyrinogen decarboxylase (URO-D) domain-containing protein n=1 Tax=Vallitalea longa TaxID=2936439 RepID=A0A9W5Y7H2_9FIRM|nr:hypothetical protein [Vallitalea longa]GKX28222.1 hypothetical protein SH1V18_07020 [Vallitalea longa]
MDYKEQVKVIRELAKQLKEISSLPKNRLKAQKWADHNDLKGNTEPLLWICPDDDGGWVELVPNETLQTEDKDLRELEVRLRRYIYHFHHFEDDFAFEPVVRFDMPGEYTGFMYGDSNQKTAWGINIDSYGISKDAYHLNNYLKDEANVEALLNHEVDFIPDIIEYTRLKDKYEEAIDNTIDIEFNIPYTVLVQSLLIELVHLKGLEELMFDLYDHADLIESIIGHMSDSKVRLLEKLEKNNMLFDNKSNIYTGSGGLGYSNVPVKDNNKVMLSDMWGFADSQEFSNVSNDMYEKFALKYQIRGLSKFGLACYGCCEPLDTKFDLIFRELPNIRRLSVSPWSDVRIAAENIKNRAIYSWKPNPAKVCTGINEPEMTRMLKETAQITKDCNVEIILKDIRTCDNTPKHLQQFIELVKRTFK